MSDTQEGSVVLLSSPGMHITAERIQKLLCGKDCRFIRCEADYHTFANGEIKPHIPETVRGKQIFFLHPMLEPDPNRAVMQLLLTCDALKRASVSGITIVAPFLPYLRQDRKDAPRVPISARLLADLIETNHKVERVITFDMHADQEQGFFSIPVDNLYGMMVHEQYFRDKFNNDFSNVAVIAPDFGGAVRARRFASRIDNVPVVIIEKKRVGIGSGDKKVENVAETLELIGPDVTGKDVILYDDMIDTGGSIINAANTLLDRGAKTVYGCVTHGIFSDTAIERFSKANMQVVVAETVSRTQEFYKEHHAWLSVVSTDELLAKAILESSLVGGSVSKLFQ